MSKTEAAKWKIISAVAGAVVLLMVTLAAEAHHRHHDITINLEYPDQSTPPAPSPGPTVQETTIFTGADPAEMLALTTGAIAAGSHQFDYSTTRWQLSLTGTWLIDESEDNFSVGVGKRFGEESFLPNSLFHGSYTPVGNHDFMQLGVTIVF